MKAIGDVRLSVGGRGTLPLYLSRGWSMPLPAISHAVIVLHGRLRNADEYFISANNAQAAAGDDGKGALMIVPQFLAEIEIEAHRLSADTLRWSLEGWQGGDAALAPSPVSSFEARRCDPGKTLGPARLSQLEAGRGRRPFRWPGRAALCDRGQGQGAIAAPAYRHPLRRRQTSPYAYFSTERPMPAIAASCSGYNNWKYGMGDRPPYLADATPAALEQLYVEREVIYLLGTLDTNPKHSALDKICMAKAQGATRYVRGHAYADAMAKRDNGTQSPGLGCRRRRP